MVSLPDMIDAKYKTSICVPKDIADKYPDTPPREVGKRIWAEAIARERAPKGDALEAIFALQTSAPSYKAQLVVWLTKNREGIERKLGWRE